MLCILALLPLADSSLAPSLTPPLADALADARMAEPETVAWALTEVVRINPTSAAGGWLADLRGFDGPERQELSDLLRKEGVGLGDRSKLRRLVTTFTQSTDMEDYVLGIPRRAQQTDGREESATNKQLKTQQEDHAGTAQPSSEQADGGLSADSASAYSFASTLGSNLGAKTFLFRCREPALQLSEPNDPRTP